MEDEEGAQVWPLGSKCKDLKQRGECEGSRRVLVVCESHTVSGQASHALVRPFAKQQVRLALNQYQGRVPSERAENWLVRTILKRDWRMILFSI